MSTKRHDQSTDKLISATSSSIEDLTIPPLNLQHVKSYDNKSASSASSASVATGKKSQNTVVIASVSIHASPETVVPVAAPRHSSTSAFEFNPKDNKNQLNNQKKSAKDIDGNTSTYDESDVVPLIELPKRNRPASARPRQQKRNVDESKKKQLPAIVFENEQSSHSNSAHSKRSGKSLKKRKHHKRTDYHAAHSDTSLSEKNDYELCEISSTSKDKGRENFAFVDDGDYGQETCLNAKESDASLKSAMGSADVVEIDGKVRAAGKKGHRRTKTIDSDKTAIVAVSKSDLITPVIGKYRNMFG